MNSVSSAAVSAVLLALALVACDEHAKPKPIVTAQLAGRLVYIGKEPAAPLDHPVGNRTYSPGVDRAYSLQLGGKAFTTIPLTPQERHVWYLARNPANGEMYYSTFDGVKDNAWYLLKSFDGITDTLERPRSADLARYPDKFAISPDGKYIAGMHRMTGGYHLWIDDLSGATPSREILGQDTWEYHPPIWSPDGKHIIFVGSLGGDWNYNELFGVDPDGSHLRQLTDLPKWASWWDRFWAPSVRHNPRWDMHKSTQARWSPDGQWVLFTSFKGVYRMHPDGSGLQLVVPHAWSPAWSPDGKLIVYVAYRDSRRFLFDEKGPELFHLYVNYPDGSAETRLTDDTRLMEYSDIYWLN